jgi:hypothetical protein
MNLTIPAELGISRPGDHPATAPERRPLDPAATLPRSTKQNVLLLGNWRSLDVAESRPLETF